MVFFFCNLAAAKQIAFNTSIAPKPCTLFRGTTPADRHISTPGRNHCAPESPKLGKKANTSPLNAGMCKFDLPMPGIQ